MFLFCVLHVSLRFLVSNEEREQYCQIPIPERLGDINYK